MRNLVPIVMGVVFGVVVGLAITQCGSFQRGVLPAYDYAEEQRRLKEKLAGLPNPTDRFILAAKIAKPAVVNIQAYGQQVVEHPFARLFRDEFFRRFFREFRDVCSMGSGVIVDPKGYVLTNHHVVAGAQIITVRLTDGRTFEAELIGSDPMTDLAVLKIDGERLPYVEFGDSDKVDVGQWVLAIGNPFGFGWTVTAGIISAKGRANVGVAEFEDFIQTDAAVNPGNSGGPLIDLNGKVIGITTAIISRTGGYQGISLAIPSNMAKTVMLSIVKHGRVLRGYMGWTLVTMSPELARRLRIRFRPGVFVWEVYHGSPAEAVGIKPGDIITAVNGKPIDDARKLRNLIAMYQAGKSVTFEVWRGKKRLNIKATIGER